MKNKKENSIPTYEELKEDLKKIRVKEKDICIFCNRDVAEKIGAIIKEK